MEVYSDSHSHGKENENVYAIHNVLAQDIMNTVFCQNKFYSIGVHPWYADNLPENIYEWMNTYIYRYPNILAVGEIGIDRRCMIDLKKQYSAFERQIQIAMTHDKPIIIHAVKSSSDIFMFIKKYKFRFMVHGFNENLKTATNYIDKGAYLSIGKAILNHNSNIRDTIRCIPIQQILIETDEEKVINPIYNEIATLLNLELDELSSLINLNFKRFYGL